MSWNDLEYECFYEVIKPLTDNACRDCIHMDVKEITNKKVWFCYALNKVANLENEFECEFYKFRR